ncbi:MAG TPA: chlorohydrolase family protein [Nitrobacter sp.]|jgi:cytosine/adenosine deaminase-related metal-dependent hydrolase|nr:chlorohydrolase family protein [Nitrobacter sp.]
MRTLIQGGWVVGHQNGAHVLIRDGVVVYEGDRILSVGPRFEGHIDRKIDAHNMLVSPGFIDTHVHCGHLAALRLITDVGRADYFGQPFFEFTTPRQGTVMRHDPRYLRADQANDQVMKVWVEFTIVELLRNGVTTFVEFGARAHVQQYLADALGFLGLRGYLGAGFNVGRWVGGEGGKLTRIVDEEHGQQIFREAVDFVTAIDGKYNGRAKGLLCPTGVEMCSLDQLRQTAVLSRELDMPVACHAAYSVLEFYDIVREHRKTPIEVLEAVGLLALGERLNIGHGNLVAEHPRLAYSGGHDIDLMGAHHCSVSHCPINIVRRARYLDDWERYRRAGVNLCLGSDTFPRDMMMQMRTASYLGKVMGNNLGAASAAEVFEAATVNGATSLGRCDLGILAPNAKADIILIDLTGKGTLRYGPVRDPIKSLVECGIADDVDTVIIDGVIRMEGGRIPNIDVDSVRRAGQSAGEAIWAEWQDWDPDERTAEQMSPMSFKVIN